LASGRIAEVRKKRRFIVDEPPGLKGRKALGHE
jgi:hypothetical protein